MNLDPEQLKHSPFVVGGVGAVVALKFVPGISWRERCTNIIAGSLTAGYLAPALVEWLGLASAGYRNGAAFVIGLLGMSLIAAVVQGVRDTPVGQILTGWLSRKG